MLMTLAPVVEINTFRSSKRKRKKESVDEIDSSGGNPIKEISSEKD